MSNLALVYYKCIACGCYASRTVDFCCAYCESAFVSETENSEFYSTLTDPQKRQLDASGITGPISYFSGTTRQIQSSPAGYLGSLGPPISERQIESRLSSRRYIAPGTYGYDHRVRFTRRNHPRMFVDSTGQIVSREGPSESSGLVLEGQPEDATEAQTPVYTVNGTPTMGRDLPRPQMRPLDFEDAEWYGAHELAGVDFYGIAPMPPLKKEKTIWKRFMTRFKGIVTDEEAECSVCMDALEQNASAVHCTANHYICLDCVTGDGFRNNFNGKCPTCRCEMDCT